MTHENKLQAFFRSLLTLVFGVPVIVIVAMVLWAAGSGVSQWTHKPI